MTQAVATGLFVPVIMLVVTLFCKFVTRRGFSFDDWMMGIDATLCALTSALIHLCDVVFQLRPAGRIEDPQQREVAIENATTAIWEGGILCLLIIIVLLYVLHLQSRWGEPGHGMGRDAKLHFGKRRAFFLLGVSNLLGVICLGGILFVLRRCTCLE